MTNRDLSSRDAHVVSAEDRLLVSIKLATSIAGVSRRTIYNWIEQGKLEYVRTAGGRVRIYADSLFRPGSDREAR